MYLFSFGTFYTVRRVILWFSIIQEKKCKRDEVFLQINYNDIYTVDLSWRWYLPLYIYTGDEIRDSLKPELAPGLPSTPQTIKVRLINNIIEK